MSNIGLRYSTIHAACVLQTCYLSASYLRASSVGWPCLVSDRRQAKRVAIFVSIGEYFSHHLQRPFNDPGVAAISQRFDCFSRLFIHQHSKHRTAGGFALVGGIGARLPHGPRRASACVENRIIRYVLPRVTNSRKTTK
jgi:hypothetical protein